MWKIKYDFLNPNNQCRITHEQGMELYGHKSRIMAIKYGKKRKIWT